MIRVREPFVNLFYLQLCYFLLFFLGGVAILVLIFCCKCFCFFVFCCKYLLNL